MLRRDMGKLSFATLRDGSGEIQLMAPSQKTERYEDFTKLGLGDWITATRRGRADPEGRALRAARLLDAAGGGAPRVR